MIEALAAAQTLLRIKVSDSVSGAALPDAAIETSIKTTVGDYRPSPFALRNMRDGWSVLGVSHRELTARVRIGVTTRFRFAVTRPGYAAAEEELFIAPGDFTAVEEDVNVGGITLRRARIAGAPFEQRITLDPLPVRLVGQLVQDNDLTDPVAGATITLDGDAGGAQTTDAEGRFRFDALPLVQTVEVTAEKGDDETAVTHIIDFKQPTNQLTLSFITEPDD